MNFEQKVEKFIRKYQLAEPGEALCVGLSGGADSVSLLLVLKELGFQVRAVHINHHLRGTDSEEDEAFVRELCEQQRIPLSVYSYAVSELAVQWKTGIEEAGRLVRQSAYADCIEKGIAEKIALAHHANDLAETFLFRAARGTSLHGLAGIRPKQSLYADTEIREDQGQMLSESVYDKNEFTSTAETRQKKILVIHPLLPVTKEEILAWLRGRGQVWRTDLTNLENSCSRNTIRNEIVPELESQVNRKTVVHIAEAAEDIAAADQFLRDEAKKRAARLTIPTVASVVIENAVMEEPAILRSYILLDAMQRLTGTAKDLGREQIRQVGELFYRRSGSRVDLPYHLTAIRDYEGVTLMFSGEETEYDSSEVRIAGEGVYELGDWEITCAFEDMDQIHPDKIRDIRYTKWFDYDKIKQNLVLRKRLPGDRLIINRKGESKKLKHYLIDEKVPERERDEIPILASGSSVYWVIGYRISEDCKVTEETKRVLRVTAEKKPDASLPGQEKRVR